MKMTQETRFHKHWYVKVRRGSFVLRVLQRPLRTTDFAHAEKSRLVWGAHDMGSDEWTLTLLGLLHGITGLTLKIEDPL